METKLVLLVILIIHQIVNGLPSYTCEKDCKPDEKCEFIYNQTAKTPAFICVPISKQDPCNGKCKSFEICKIGIHPGGFFSNHPVFFCVPKPNQDMCNGKCKLDEFCQKQEVFSSPFSLGFTCVSKQSVCIGKCNSNEICRVTSGTNPFNFNPVITCVPKFYPGSIYRN